MKTLGLALAIATALGGCGEEEGGGGSGSGNSAEIECVGMTYATPLAGYSRVATRFGARCNWLVSDTIYNDEPAIATAENLGQENTAALTFVTQGQTWVAVSGSLRIERNEGTLMAGNFDVLTRAPDGTELRISGPFDFCAYGARADCPHQSAGGLEKHVGFTETGGAKAEHAASYASACRVLIDRASGGMQVDLQLGIYNGINIAHWVDQCELGWAPLDHFTFRAGGVTGPGEYGPYLSSELPHPDGHTVTLPELDFGLPLHYLGRSTSCLTDVGRTINITAAAGRTSCSWTVSENPGKFSLNCTDAARLVTRDPLPEDTDLVLNADCDVRYRD